MFLITIPRHHFIASIWINQIFYLKTKQKTIIFMSITLHTTHGDIKFELFCELTPKTCKNFLALCGKKYYDGTVFHRNIKGFII